MTSLKIEFLFGPGSRGLAVTKRNVSVRHGSDTSVCRPLHDSQLDAVIGAKKTKKNQNKQNGDRSVVFLYKTSPSGGCWAQRQQQNY